jgi:hypothetical protein
MFKLLGAGEPPHISRNAQRFVTPKQAEDIKKNTHQAPTHSNVGKDMAYYLFRLFKGFYPNVEFSLEIEDDSPNAYAYINHEKPFIIVNGGLIRTDIVDFNLLTLIIACNLGSIYGGVPLNKAGYSCRGQADYMSTAKVLKEVLYGPLLEAVAGHAMDKVKELFSKIEPEHADAGEGCNGIPIDCRLEAMWAGLMSMPLPECAGGPKKPFLEVTVAEASISGNIPEITISFNANVNESSAMDVKNYDIQPIAEVLSACVDEKDSSKIVLEAKIEPDTEYNLSVYNVLSEKDQPLISSKRSAKFVVKEVTDGQ